MSKKAGKSKGYISKGSVNNVSRSTKRLMKRSVTESEKMERKIQAWKQCKRVMLTVPNLVKGETRERFVRVEATKILGKPDQRYRIKAN